MSLEEKKEELKKRVQAAKDKLEEFKLKYKIISNITIKLEKGNPNTIVTIKELEDKLEVDIDNLSEEGFVNFLKEFNRVEYIINNLEGPTQGKTNLIPPPHIPPNTPPRKPPIKHGR